MSERTGRDVVLGLLNEGLFFRGFAEGFEFRQNQKVFRASGGALRGYQRVEREHVEGLPEEFYLFGRG